MSGLVDCGLVTISWFYYNIEIKPGNCNVAAWWIAAWCRALK
jgi:hypothetical protein